MDVAKTADSCFVVAFFVSWAAIALLILGFAMLEAKGPITTFESLMLHDFSVFLDVVRHRAQLNFTVDAHLWVKQPNWIGFNYTNSTALLNYRRQLVGAAPIPAGEIGTGATKGTNLRMTVTLSNSQLYSDIIARALPLNTSNTSGVSNPLNFRVVSSTSSDFTIYVSNRTVGDQRCKYTTNL